MLDFNVKQWIKLNYKSSPVYVYPEGPDWIVPNSHGDKLLQSLQNDQLKKNDKNLKISDFRVRQFISEITIRANKDNYAGRSAHLSLTSLKECWFHITDKCNLSCSHCLFSCSPSDKSMMGLEEFSSFFNQAFKLGARTFFLTGGEPMVHPDFKNFCTLILNKSQENDLVILSNGLLLPKFIDFFKSLPPKRLHIQISMDGNQENHDKLRGKGTFERLSAILADIKDLNFQLTLAMSVTLDNMENMVDIVEIAHKYKISNVHYLWMLAVGKSKDVEAIPTEKLLNNLINAHKKASEYSITIDNVQAIEGQVFSPQGTKHDLGNAGWESLAIAPDGSVYPTPALIRAKDAYCGNLCDGLEAIWKNSTVLKQIRSLSIADDPDYSSNPLRFLSGGGDIDHSYYNSGSFTGHDPYNELSDMMVLWLIADSAKSKQNRSWPCILMKMGDRLLNCDDAHGDVALTHSNCVLSMSTINSRVGGFYSDAATSTNTDIINPVCYPEEDISHIPETSRIRSYGCGSPVMDAGIMPGETLVDLGSGAGMECFIGAEKVGRTGKVFGIDMTDPMLELAMKSLKSVEKNLGYKNVKFIKAHLENIPLEEDSVNIVISNCVINLSGDKHRTFGQIFKVLKPGGRLVISDIVTDTVPPPSILNDPKLRGECISGALTQTRLMSILELTGFEDITINKRFFYREVQGHLFYSITYTAFKPDSSFDKRAIVYPGPFAAVITDRGDLVLRGEKRILEWSDDRDISNHFFILDDNGNAINIDAENSCACYQPPEAEKILEEKKITKKSMTGCMLCGKPLQYLTEDKLLKCDHCGQEKMANALCENGHFICDACHSKDAYEIVMDICLNSTEVDMIKLLNSIRKHPAMPLHGPEHHFAVPGAIVAAYKNLGGGVGDKDIKSAIERGKVIPGGTCGFWGGCGAALGVGIAFAVILESSPVKPEQRQVVQQITGEIIRQISLVKASRCCQREAWTAMLIASEMSAKALGFAIPVDTNISCTQMGLNNECPGTDCRFYKKSKKQMFQVL